MNGEMNTDDGTQEEEGKMAKKIKKFFQQN